MHIFQKSGVLRLTAISSKSRTGDLRTKSAQNQLQKVLKTLVAQAFSGFSLTHILRTKSTLEQQGDILDGFLLFVVSWMNIPVHGCLEVRLSQDALDRLHICPCVVQHRAYRVPENVRGGPMEVHRGVDALHHTSERGERQRLLRVLLAYHKALLAHRQEEGQKIRDDGNFAEPAFGLRCSNEGLKDLAVSSPARFTRAALPISAISSSLLYCSLPKKAVASRRFRRFIWPVEWIISWKAVP